MSGAIAVYRLREGHMQMLPFFERVTVHFSIAFMCGSMECAQKCPAAVAIEGGSEKRREGEGSRQGGRYGTPNRRSFTPPILLPLSP